MSRLLDVAEVASTLGVSKSTIRRLRAAGELPAVTVGLRLVRWRAVDVDAFLARHRDGARRERQAS